MNGTVVLYNRKRGWGFATPSDNSTDIFLHASHLPLKHKYLTEGDEITFEIGERDGRPLALNIRILKEATVSAVKS